MMRPGIEPRSPGPEMPKEDFTKNNDDFSLQLREILQQSSRKIISSYICQSP